MLSGIGQTGIIGRIDLLGSKTMNRTALYPLIAPVLFLVLAGCVQRPDRWDSEYLAQTYSCSDLYVLDRRLQREKADAGGSVFSQLQQLKDPIARARGNEAADELDRKFNDRQMAIYKAKAARKCL